ncbi:Mitochondrial transcription termination factor family protein [Thalictrum thalictroides]|uniref:Mitochondrial transcription termination factor family protein n=1 Tax=Thalictrum thalictroides TaxID=46969 RepID=A0A7J6VN56_THATH|nr:Mitochondrial transcription termination factor family protein [Thalictrum thalictroides]
MLPFLTKTSQLSYFSSSSSSLSSFPPSQSSSESESSSSSSTLLTNYLIKTFDWSKEEAMSVSKSLHHLKSFKTPDRPDSVITMLQDFGLSRPQIASAVLRKPSILTSKHETLLPKLKLLQSIGVSGLLLSKLVVPLMGSNIDRQLTPSINFLQIILEDDRNVLIALAKCPEIICNDPNKTPLKNLEFLEEKGLDSSLISRFVLIFPLVLRLSSKQLFVTYKIAEELGFEKFLSMMTGFEVKFNAYDKILKGFGFNEFCVDQLKRWSPFFLVLGSEKLKEKLEILLEVVDSSTLMKYSYLLCLSLEGRIIPRYEIINNLQSIGLLQDEVDFAKVFLMPTSSFLDEYVNNFKIEYGADMIQDCEDQQREKDFVFGDSELEEMASFSSNMFDRKPQTITQNLLQGSGKNEGMHYTNLISNLR